MTTPEKPSRRKFLRLLGLGGASVALGVPAVRALTPPPTPEPELVTAPDVITHAGYGCTSMPGVWSDDHAIYAHGGLCAPLSPLYEFHPHKPIFPERFDL